MKECVGSANSIINCFTLFSAIDNVSYDPKVSVPDRQVGSNNGRGDISELILYPAKPEMSSPEFLRLLRFLVNQ
jgi:hypothetical protein